MEETQPNTPISDLVGRFNRLDKRLDLFLTLNGALGLLVLVCAVIAGGFLFGGKQESALINKLRAEAALRDARFQATKGLLWQTGNFEALLKIQEIADRYGYENFRNGHIDGKTPYDVHREACTVYEKEGFPCRP